MEVRYWAVGPVLSGRKRIRLRTRRAALGATLALITASCTGAARAQDAPPPPDASSVTQYVELVPTAGGPTAPGVGSNVRFPLLPPARRALDKTSRSTAKALTAIATSSTYGAVPPPARPHEARSLPALEDSSLDRSLRAVATAVAAASEARAIALLVVLVAVTAAGAALSVRRRV